MSLILVVVLEPSMNLMNFGEAGDEAGAEIETGVGVVGNAGT